MTNDYGNLELHTVLLAAMKDIDKICRENGLRYFLHAGTLLGAVNHKGFIPWDDDVDISMTVHDYEKLSEIVQEKYSEKYLLETYDNTKTHYSKLNKLRIRNTVVCYENGIEEPVFIDLSVFHAAPDNKIARELQRVQLEYWDKVIAVKGGRIRPASLISKMLLGMPARLSKERIGRIVDRVMTKYDCETTTYYALMIHMLPNPYTGTRGYYNDFVPRKICDNPQYIPFEDSEFMVYSDPILDLERRYGPDYWKPYPEEKRVSKHGIVGYHINM